MNYYEILGVAKNATKDDIKRAFKKLVVKYHPDKNADNPQAGEFFLIISEANQILSDDIKRTNYDDRFIKNAYQREYEAILEEQEKQRKAAVYQAFYSHYQEHKVQPIDHKKYRYLYGVFTACLLGVCLLGYFLKIGMDRYSSENHYQLAQEQLIKKDYHMFHKELHIARYLNKSEKTELLYVRGLVEGMAKQNKDTLLKEIKTFEKTFTGKNKDEYRFLLGVMEYHKGNKKIAFSYFQNAEKSYSGADWYYYVGILQAELYADENLFCNYLQIAAKMGEARAQAALASYCW